MKVPDATGSYNECLAVGIGMKHAELNISTFVEFSKLDKKRFNEAQYINKWKSFEKYDADASSIQYYLIKKEFSTQKYTALESISEELTTSPMLDSFQHYIAREFKRLYQYIAKFSCGNMFVCVAQKGM